MGASAGGPFIIDTHVHVASPDLQRYPRDPHVVEGSPSGPAWHETTASTAEDLLGNLDSAGVDRAVVVQAMTAYRFDNSYARDTSLAQPELLTSVATIDLTVEDPLPALERWVGQGSMRGLRWVGAPTDPGEARARVIWEAVRRLGVPVLFIPVGAEVEQLAEHASALPGPAALDHCGFASFEDGIPPALRAMAPAPQLSLKVTTLVLDAMEAAGGAAEGVAELSRLFGPDRLMWGSDWAHTHDRTYAELVETALEASRLLDRESAAQWLGGTAARFWPELRP